MKIEFSKHVLEEKIPLLRSLNWKVSKAKIKLTIKKPKWRGKTRYGQTTAMSLLDDKHILRVIFKKRGGIITVVTIHPARRGTYESTKED